ncbi:MULTISPECIES: 2-amino-4-hydroxy-6-hydroxymethyldihydropteridine diphosphokinase [unclassified Rhizobium]|uniref:2-amino-4-hydroxy-6- hydroxymethyldihydropteridine diphosphokinase n=1 Tax=unclassified Rhizobium TaxID=2613769 RepID=UPI000715B92C|nr:MULTISPECIES: 2-amino-4-hydroxy-6-hydroxymethyldihydropteridine diphosphokinase [unclassified Rhizobium]KQS98171.1 2-amino-4-hydroxy-6-hydroxymethyldihydropteridine pyrophosphokinase [Rhizobium sp. Leaf386]KQT00434.1 2-amino-4-hydroxy-6-hydroxymethyldihydropteridine pyrophosphokinase [Rhizobium sp. Leaf391]KQT97437.1 2-amino-4-hydroxy-6-hydroxymethyldihydropteridine pyrophosphokinase [Rhizobium sp. Leaf453]
MIPHDATLGLGGNIGNPAVSMARALTLLDAREDCAVTAVSRLYRTPPWGKTDQAWFFNACAQVRTSLSPDDLLDACLSIEKQMKRERLERWGPRTIDIDILTFGDLAQHTETLQIPHPRMTERGFVLMPLADFAPDLVVSGRAVRDWLKSADVAYIEIADADRDWWRKPA